MTVLIDFIARDYPKFIFTNNEPSPQSIITLGNRYVHPK